VTLWLAAPVDAASPVESHCVVQVVDQTDQGELVVGAADCYLSFADAQAASAEVQFGRTAQGVTTDGTDVVFLLSTTLGIHYDGLNGGGSSITVVGSSCSGGWWNTGATWANRISSSWNGCHRLRHYDRANQGGSWADTIGVGAVHNLPLAMNNKTESVAYLGS
jgi:hypothetical protein